MWLVSLYLAKYLILNKIFAAILYLLKPYNFDETLKN